MKKNSSRSSLFLIEIILGILFFSIAAAICVQLFIRAHLMGQSSTDLNRGISLAQTAAETFRACDGSLSETAALLSATAQGETLTAYYTADAQPCGPEEAVYTLSLTHSYADGISSSEISVTRDAEPVYSLEADCVTGGNGE